MAHKTEFLYLSEKDTIEAGVLNAEKCIDNAEEVFTLLSKGDYLMGEAITIAMDWALFSQKKVHFRICLWQAQTEGLSLCLLT